MSDFSEGDRRHAILAIEAIGATLLQLGPVSAAALFAKLSPPPGIRFAQFSRLLDRMAQAGLLAKLGGDRLLWTGPIPVADVKTKPVE